MKIQYIYTYTHNNEFYLPIFQRKTSCRLVLIWMRCTSSTMKSITSHKESFGVQMLWERLTGMKSSSKVIGTTSKVAFAITIVINVTCNVKSTFNNLAITYMGGCSCNGLPPESAQNVFLSPGKRFQWRCRPLTAGTALARLIQGPQGASPDRLKAVFQIDWGYIRGSRSCRSTVCWLLFLRTGKKRRTPVPFRLRHRRNCLVPSLQLPASHRAVVSSAVRERVSPSSQMKILDAQGF